MVDRTAHDRAKELVFAASRLPRDQRQPYVERLAAGDAALLAEVRSLLEWLDEGTPPFHGRQPQMAPDLRVGDLLERRYRIGAKLGQGRSGSVYRAHDQLLNLPVAIKRSNAADQRRREQLCREAVVARTIQHPNVRRVYDVLPAGEELYLVLELVEGRDLGACLRDEGLLSAPEVAALALQIASGLAALHEAGIVHGDLKPENILLRVTGSAVITDFGLASRSSDAGPATPGGGTPRYLSPERLRGAPSSPSSDVYALALLLRDLLLGRSEEPEAARQTTGVEVLVPEVDPCLAHAISCGLRPEDSRPTHAGEFLALLRAEPHPPQPARAARRPVTALWCEFRVADDDEPSRVLRRRQLAIEIARAHDGYPLEAWSFRGLLVLFGVLETRDRQETRAVRAALEMAAKLRAPTAPAASIALDTQIVEVLVDDAGSPILGRSFDWLRETAQAERPGSVVVSQALRASIDERFALRPIEGAGRYEVLFESRPNSMHQALRPDRAEVVGREQEKQRLLARFERVRATGEGAVVVVSGAPGIGKTRLIGEVGLALRGRCRWIEVTCPDEDAEPLEPWRSVIEQLSSKRIPPRGLAELLLGRDASAMEPRLRQACLIEALAGRISEVSLQIPTVLVFEDLHWCGPDSLQLLAGVAEEVGRLGVLLVLSWRRGFTRFEVASSWETIALGPLDAAATEAMLADLLGRVDARSQDVGERSGGVPLFVEQLARVVREGDSLDAIPVSLQALLFSRLDRLGTAVEVAHAAAVIGSEFTSGTLARVTGLEASALGTALERLAAEGLIEAVPPSQLDSFRFRHALLQQSAYESAPAGARRALHEACLAATGDTGPDAPLASLLASARHCEGAGRSAEAISRWVDAAGRSLALSATASAVEYFQRALSLGPDLDRELEIRVEMLRAQELTLTFARREASDNAERALELLPEASDPGRAASLLYLLGGSYVAQADVRLMALSGRTEALALDSPDPWLRASFSAQCGNRDCIQGKLEVAREWYLRSLKAGDELVAGSIRRINPIDPRTIASTGMAFLEALRCSPGTRVYAERALAGPGSDDFPARCYALVHLAQVALVRGELEVASSRLAEAEALAEARRMDVYRSLAILFRACVTAQIGEPAAAAATIQACLAELKAAGWGAFEGFGLSYVALAEELRGHWREAREALDRGIDLGSTTLDSVWVAELRRQRAALLAHCGEPPAEVAVEYERAIRLAQAQGAVALELRARTSLVRWQPETRRRERARAELASLVERPGLDPTSRDLLAARALLVVR